MERAAAEWGCTTVWRMANLKEYLDRQLAEALGPVNRWYCSEHYGRCVSEPNMLIEYYIKHGGAEHFARQISGRIFRETLCSARRDN